MAYSQETADKICARLAEGESLRSICRDEGMPAYSTVRGWESDDPEFLARSTRAREEGCHAMAQDCLQIADDGHNDWMEKHGREGELIGWTVNGEHVQRSKLRIETRMRLLGKWLPKVYGDKVELGGSLDVNSKIERITRRIVDGTGTGDA